MSLRLRTALVGIIIAAVSSAAAALSSYFLLAARIETNVNSSLATVSSFFLDEVRRSPFADPVAGQDLGAYSVQAVDRDGKQLPISGIKLPVVKLDIEVALGRVGHYVRDEDIEGSAWRIRTTSTRYGAIQVALNYKEATADLATVRLLSLTIGLVVAAAGGVASWVVTRRALAPLQDLTSAVEDIAAGELDVEVEGGGSSEVQRLAGAFNRTIAALRQSRTEQRRIVQDVGHDLRTPLTSLLNNVTILGKHQLDAVERAQVLQDLGIEVRTLKQLVDAIVDVASGAYTAEEFEEHDLFDRVGDIVLREARRHDRDIEIVGEGPRTGVVAAIQPQAFDRAVGNLVGNAVKYSHDRIEVSLRVDGAHAWVEVADRGIGLQGVDPKLLFQRFWRADSARSSSGSGLGLAIVQEVAERHHGSTTAREREGGGAVIGFSVAVT
jgi:two-component system sensor histidine kinase MprB